MYTYIFFTTQSKDWQRRVTFPPAMNFAEKHVNIIDVPELSELYTWNGMTRSLARQFEQTFYSIMEPKIFNLKVWMLILGLCYSSWAATATKAEDLMNDNVDIVQAWLPLKNVIGNVVHSFEDETMLRMLWTMGSRSDNFFDFLHSSKVIDLKICKNFLPIRLKAPLIQDL